MTDGGSISSKYLKVIEDVDQRELLNQNLQPDVQKVDSIIRKITDKKAPYSELMRLDGAIDRLKATIAMEIKKGG